MTIVNRSLGCEMPSHRPTQRLGDSRMGLVACVPVPSRWPVFNGSEAIDRGSELREGKV